MLSMLTAFMICSIGCISQLWKIGQNNHRLVVSSILTPIRQVALRGVVYFVVTFILTRQVTRATHVRNRVCPRVELISKIIIILLIIFLGFIKSKPC